MAELDLRRGYEMELARERDAARRALRRAVGDLTEARLDAEEGRPPNLGRIQSGLIRAADAYQRVAAWQALERLEFMLPDTDETKGD